MNIIYGKNTISLAMESKKVSIRKYYSVKGNESIFSNKKNVSYVSNEYLNNITNNSNHQGVAAEIEGYQYLSYSDFKSKNSKKDNVKVALLDGVTDAGNFGSIIRSALAFGMDAIFILDKRQAQVTPVTHKASAGASFILDIVRVSNLNNTIKKLKEDGFWVYSTDLKSNDHLENVDFDKKSCIVIGSEGKGVSKLVLSSADFTFKIPMKNDFDSLNVSSASTVLFYEMTKN